jgi:hypothetical protein
MHQGEALQWIQRKGCSALLRAMRCADPAALAFPRIVCSAYELFYGRSFLASPLLAYFYWLPFCGRSSLASHWVSDFS